jgi:metal-responsive CopG/Arc/MetJ family transcriptional regulator
MEQLDVEFKSTNICFKVTKTLNDEIDKLMKKKKWKKSAFIRVAIQKELNRLAQEGKNVTA